MGLTLGEGGDGEGGGGEDLHELADRGGGLATQYNQAGVWGQEVGVELSLEPDLNKEELIEILSSNSVIN